MIKTETDPAVQEKTVTVGEAVDAYEKYGQTWCISDGRCNPTREKG